MKKAVIRTSKAPSAIGPYNQAVAVNNLIFTSGQIALNPTTGIMVQSSIEDETRQVLDNLTAVLKAGGASLEDVVRVTVYVTDIGHFSRVNSVYSTYFPVESAPARVFIAVKSLPKNAQIEVSAIASAGQKN